MKNLLILILIAFSVSGCRGEGPTQPVASLAKTVQVDILKFQFVPADVTINKGDTVIWVNQEKRQYHSVWFEQLAEPEPDYFFPGESYSRTFDTVGVFPYRCGPHPQMLGSVIVK